MCDTDEEADHARWMREAVSWRADVALDGVAALRGVVRVLEQRVISLARDAGYSYGEIGRALGMTRQAIRATYLAAGPVHPDILKIRALRQAEDQRRERERLVAGLLALSRANAQARAETGPSTPPTSCRKPPGPA